MSVVKADFDIATDLKVYLWSVEDEDAFIIGYSLLGGPKVLRPNNIVPKQIECQVFELQATSGFDLETSTLFQSTANQLSMGLRVRNSDPLSNSNWIMGRRISVEPTGFRPPPIFVGYIAEYDFTYVPGEPVTMRVTAHDGSYYINQFRVDKPGPPDTIIDLGPPLKFYDPATLRAQVSYILEGFNPPQTPAGFYVDNIGNATALFLETSVDIELFKGIAGELINTRIQGEQGYYVYSAQPSYSTDPDGLVLVARSEVIQTLSDPPSFVFDTSGEEGLCPFSINFGSSLQYIDNDVSVDLTQDPDQFVIKSDPGSQETYGANSTSASFPFLNVANLERWADYALNSKARPQVQALSVAAIDRAGDLINVINCGPGLGVRVKTEYNGAILDEAYIVTRQTHNITADNWTIDLNLWKKN
jgi:hypothetical protein